MSTTLNSNLLIDEFCESSKFWTKSTQIPQHDVPKFDPCIHQIAKSKCKLAQVSIDYYGSYTD